MACKSKGRAYKKGGLLPFVYADGGGLQGLYQYNIDPRQQGIGGTGNNPSMAQQIVGEFGPIGAMISAASGVGTSIGRSIKNDNVGGAIEGAFDPAAILQNKNMSIGSRILGAGVPILGGIWARKANKEAEKKARKETEFNAQSSVLSKERLSNLGQQQQYSFPNGGNLNVPKNAYNFGEPIQDPLEMASAFRTMSTKLGDQYTIDKAQKVIPNSEVAKYLSSTYEYPYSYYTPVTHKKTGNVFYQPVLTGEEHKKITKEKGLNEYNPNKFAVGGGLSRSEDYGSKDKPYPSVAASDFAGKGRSYPIPTKADAIDALRLAGLHGRSDVRAKVFAKYPDLKKELGGIMLDSYATGGSIKYANGGSYKIKPGDSLSKISKTTGVSMEDLIRLNNIKNPNIIITGKTLKLPSTEPTVGSPTYDQFQPTSEYLSAQQTYEQSKEPEVSKLLSMISDTPLSELDNKAVNKLINDTKTIAKKEDSDIQKAKKDIRNASAKVRDAIHKLGVPLQATALVYDLLGGKGAYTEKSLTDNELKELRNIARRSKRGAIKYPDYQTQVGENVYSDVTTNVGTREGNKQVLGKINDPSYEIKTTLGQAGIEVTPQGDTIVVDQYDFNNKVKDPKFRAYLQEALTKGSDIYSQARTLGKYYGSAPGEGAPVRIDLSSSPEMATGGIMFDSYAHGGGLNFKSAGAYKNWLGYVHAKGLAESTPGHQKVSIRGQHHNVKHADGGYLEETRNMPNMTYYANGGTHEESPIGGIPLQGKGLVEQGEFRYGDFIFSNRF